MKKDSAILGSALIANGVGIVMRNSVTRLYEDDISKLSENKVNTFDRSAVKLYSENCSYVSDIAVAACILLPSSFIFDGNIRNDAITISAMYAETCLLTAAVSSISKGTFRRVRPFVYNDDVPMSIKKTADAKKSFISQHTAFAFSSAVFVSMVFSDYHPDLKTKYVIWGGSLFVASSVGYMRFRSGEHFPTDIIAGAMVGGIIGYYIPHTHKKRSPHSMSMQPIILPDNLAIVFTWAF